VEAKQCKIQKIYILKPLAVIIHTNKRNAASNSEKVVRPGVNDHKIPGYCTVNEAHFL